MANITQEEKDFVQKLQETYSEVTVKLGQVQMEIHDLETTLNELNELKKGILNQYTDARKSEQDFINSLSDKYGTGSLNLETGEFVPGN